MKEQRWLSSLFPDYSPLPLLYFFTVLSVLWQKKDTEPRMYLLAQAASILTVRYDSRRLVVDLELFRYLLINIEDTNRKQDAIILSTQ